MVPVPDICPHCGSRRPAAGERCPDCGRSRVVSPRRRRRSLIVAAVVGGVLIVAAIGWAAHKASERRATDAAEQRAVVAALRARISERQAPRRGSASQLRPAAGASAGQQRTARHALVLRVERVITADARRRDRTGELDGPIQDTRCRPISSDPASTPDDQNLSAPIGRYNCTARIRDVPGADRKPIAVLGHPYVAALDFQRFTYVYCRNTPAQGERGVALVFVRLDRACLAARGRAMGTGYADVPDPPVSDR